METRRQKKSPAALTTITDLPEAILLHIISFLPTPAAVATSAVAPTWRNLWRSVPSLKFDQNCFQDRHPEKSNREGRLLFAEFVNQALRRRPRHLSIQKFELRFFYRNYDHVRAYVDSWVRMLVNLRAVELDLNFDNYGWWRPHTFVKDDGEEDDELFTTLYEFHFSKIVSSSIEVLKLQACSIVFPGKELCVKLNSIKKVHLRVSGDADEIEQLVASRVNLETFVLEFDGYSRDLSIVSESLRHLTIIGHSVMDIEKNLLEICTPRLESIVLDWRCCGLYILKDVPSLVEATTDLLVSSLRDYACWTNVVSSLTGVERLAIGNLFLDSSFPKTYEDVKNIIEEEGSENPMHIPKSAAKEELEKLEIPDNLVAFQIPHLRVVKMEGYLGTKNEMYVVDLLKKHGVVLEKIVAVPAKVKVGDKEISPPPFLL